MKHFNCLLILLLLGTTLGCQGKVSPERASFHPRIISLAPHITETLFALGLEKNIIGRTSGCDYPPAAKKIEQVATFSGQGNLERILLLKPDLILSTGLEQEPLEEKLKSLGLRVVVISPRSLNEVISGILEIGELADRRQQARELAAEIKRRVNKIRAQAAAIPREKRPKVFVEIWSDPLMTAGPGSFVDELITLAGGRNIAYDTARPYSQFSPELVIQRDPDFILLGYMQAKNDPELIRRRMGWQDIQAVKSGRIIAEINPDLFLRPGPRLVEGLEKIQARIFPLNESEQCF